MISSPELLSNWLFVQNLQPRQLYHMVNRLIHYGRCGINALLDTILPQVCIGCYRRLDNGSVTGNLAILSNWCFICHRSLFGGYRPVNHHNNSFAITGYAGSVRAIIMRIKEYGDYQLLKALLHAVVPQINTFIIENVANCTAKIMIIPAPTRRKHHEIDIAAQLAQTLVQQVPHLYIYAPIFRLLPRAKDSTVLNRAQRKENLAQNLLCVISKNVLINYRQYPIVLIDDIITSGATAHSVEQALWLCGLKLSVTMAICSG